MRCCALAQVILHMCYERPCTERTISSIGHHDHNPREVHNITKVLSNASQLFRSPFCLLEAARNIPFRPRTTILSRTATRFRRTKPLTPKKTPPPKRPTPTLKKHTHYPQTGTSTNDYSFIPPSHPPPYSLLSQFSSALVIMCSSNAILAVARSSICVLTY